MEQVGRLEKWAQISQQNPCLPCSASCILHLPYVFLCLEDIENPVKWCEEITNEIFNILQMVAES
jgi:hypothetical protein